MTNPGHQQIPTHHRFRDLTGQRFGRLLVLGYLGQICSNGTSAWDVLCDCGVTRRASGPQMVSGHTQSCGCYARERSRTRHRTHGMRWTPIWRVWYGMIERCCTSPTHDGYSSYAGRGITVCERWRTFENFYADMGDRPFPGAQLDRINNDGNYEPGNVRWATSTQNGRNKRNNRLLTLDGASLTIQEWSERTGIPATTIKSRVQKGWDLRRALTLPTGQKTGPKPRVVASLA